MDLILFNGNVFTVDERQKYAEAIGIKGNKIEVVGSNQEVLAHRIETTRCIDLQRNTVIPGFNDGHLHLLNHGIIKDNIILQGCTDKAQVIQKAKEYIKDRKVPRGEWVEGRGWDQNLFEEKVMLTRHDLDLISEENPVVLTRVCGCMCVVNTAGLKAMGVFDSQPVIEGGEIELDEEGRPTGRMLGNAEVFTYEFIPKLSKERIKRYIVTSMECYMKSGITSVQACDLGLAKCRFKDILDAYFELDQEGRLPIRANKMLFLQNKKLLEEFLALGYKTGNGSDFFKIGPYKLQPDGSLGSRTAYLSVPYEDDPSTRGVLNNSPEEFYELIELAYTNGLQVVADAIGDGTLDMVLEAYKKLMDQYPRKDPRFCIDHCQITTEEILDKFKNYGVIGGLESVFLSSDIPIIEDRVGIERARWTYNWKGFLNRGIPIAIGSDSPVESYNPMLGIYAAVVRADFDGHPEGGWLPDQKLTLEEAIYAYTLGPAYCTYEEHIKGSITPGKWADITVLSENIFEIEPKQLKTVTAKMTIVDGKIVHSVCFDLKSFATIGGN
ncbi:MAG: amidohydrolase [Clostridia bacterium]|nr:amidohydrolase [Clostridia bacterium]